MHGAVHRDRAALAVQHARSRAARATGADPGTATTGRLAVVGERELVRSTRHVRMIKAMYCTRKRYKPGRWVTRWTGNVGDTSL
jgi:hypothetical protein